MSRGSAPSRQSLYRHSQMPLALLLAISTPARVRAEEVVPQTRAWELYVQARTALDRGDHTAAIRGFQESYSVYPFSRTLRKVASTYADKHILSQRDEDLVKSFEFYEKFLATAVLDGQDASNRPEPAELEGVRQHLAEGHYRSGVCFSYKHLAERERSTAQASAYYERSFQLCPVNMLYSLFLAARIEKGLGHSERAVALCRQFTEEATKRRQIDVGTRSALNECLAMTAARGQGETSSAQPITQPPPLVDVRLPEVRPAEPLRYSQLAPLEVSRQDPAPVAPTAVAPAPAALPIQLRLSPQINHARNLKRAGVAFLVIGAIGVAVGGTAGLAAYGLENDVQQEYLRTGLWTPELDRRAQLAADTWPISYITAGTGAGLMLLGGLLFGTGSSGLRQTLHHAAYYQAPSVSQPPFR